MKLLGFATMVAAVACDGPGGPSGAQGEAGAQGKQGVAGPAGATGPAGPASDAATGTFPDAGATVQTSCLSPCHGFDGIVAQFQGSGHYLEYLANASSATPEVAWTQPATACGNCHAIDALALRVAGAVGTLDNATIANVYAGELEYLDPVSQKVNDGLYTGSATVAEVYCTTCHVVSDATDPHRTGIPWTPGSFPLVVADGADAGVFLERSPSTSAVTGALVGNLGPANTCVWCHRSRKDVTQYITATANVVSAHWGPHEGPQADVFTAAGGYEFPGETYGTSTHQLKLSCVDCHMAPVAANAGIGDHSFAPKLSACLGCHAGATSFDVNGGQTLNQTEMFELEADLNAAGLLTRSAASPYLPLSAANLADGAFDTDAPRSGAGSVDGGAPGVDAAEAGALYNYLLIAKGGGGGVHNPKYTQQLVFDSVFALTGKAPVSLPVRPI
jgi:hypothetical protein